MSELFLQVLNMSIRAGWLILAVTALRFLFKKAPGFLRMCLWAMTAVCLLLPMSIESSFSLVPNDVVIPADIMLSHVPHINSGISSIDNAVNTVIADAFTPFPGTSMNPLQFWIPMASILWLLGIAGLIGYMVISYFKLRRQVRDAVLSESYLYISGNILSPFVFGIGKPRIYLPTQLQQEDHPYVLLHEQAHVRRLDHLWKPFGFVILSIHWFNPLVWLSYALFCKDLEFACDEAVIKTLDTNQRANYAQALLNCCTEHNSFRVSPLAFGEVDVKSRVKSILSYKKPGFWIILITVAAILTAGLCLLTNPAEKFPTSPIGEDIKNPNWVKAYNGWSDGNTLYRGDSTYPIDEEAAQAIVPLIFDRKYKTIEESQQTQLTTRPYSLTIIFHYGLTYERWDILYDTYITREVYKHNRFVQKFYYQLEPEFQTQLDEWYNTMAVPTAEEILDRLS